MAGEITRCPLCDSEDKVVQRSDAYHVNCDHCGKFKIVPTLLAGLGKEEEKGLLPYLSAHTRQANQHGEEVTLHTGNWKDFALAHKSTPLSRRITKLLELVASRSEPGSPVTLKPAIEAPLVDAKSKQQMVFLLTYLVETGCLQKQASGQYLMEVKGWEQLQPTAGIPGKCFVAMSFAQDLKPVWLEGIKPAVKIDCKMDPVRMDFVEHNDKICDKMIADIRTCQFLVADVTRQRANVYFEGGFAMGLGRPVIWTCSEDDRKEVHFDTRQYNHIFWKDPKD